MARRREPTPLRLVRAAPPIDYDDREPAPCLHGHFPHIPFREHQHAVGASYKPYADSSLRGDQRLKRRMATTLSEDELSALASLETGEPDLDESGELPRTPAGQLGGV